MMADIELVIRINKEVVEAFDKAKKENALNYYMNVYKDDLYNAIKNGTPLEGGYVECTFKNDALGDPLVTKDALVALETFLVS